jgi:hypothetical protein
MAFKSASVCSANFGIIMEARCAILAIISASTKGEIAGAFQLFPCFSLNI